MEAIRKEDFLNRSRLSRKDKWALRILIEYVNSKIEQVLIGSEELTIPLPNHVRQMGASFAEAIWLFDINWRDFEKKVDVTDRVKAIMAQTFRDKGWDVKLSKNGDELFIEAPFSQKPRIADAAVEDGS